MTGPLIKVSYAEEIARAGLEIEAVKLSPENPFTWASGYRMPIYNDNRMFLFNFDYRRLISSGFLEMISNNEIHWNIIAGTSTAGISPATTLADITESPLIYVREKPKDHGLKNKIEGIDADSDLKGGRVVLVEDLISFGGSSAGAVQAIRNANGVCDYCLSIFNYGLKEAKDVFSSLRPKCNVLSLLTYDLLFRVAKETGYVNDEQIKVLEEWREDPRGWGERHRFPRIERK